MDVARMWQSLTNNPADQGYENTKIAVAHIPDITTSKVSDIETWISNKGYLTSSSLSDYATQDWVTQKNYITGGYIGTTALQASSANQSLSGITQLILVSASNPSANSISVGNYNSSPRPRWTFTDNSTMPATTVSKWLAYRDEIPTSLKCPNKLTFKDASNATTVQYDGSASKTVTAADLGALTSHQVVSLTGGTNSGTLKLTVGSAVSDNISVTNVVTTDGPQTISGIKTHTANIILNGVSILPSGDAVDGGSGLGYLGSSSKRFRQGHIRDLYTSYFIFKDGDTGNPQGSINFLTGAGFFNVVDRTNFPTNPKTFSYKFYVNSNDNGLFYDETYRDDNNVLQHGNYVPLGKSDHRWSKLWATDADLAGSLKLSGTNKKIYFGDTYYIELVDLGSGNTPRYALHTNAPLYSDSWIADGGIQQTS